MLLLALGASYGTFVTVLRPEFDRQKEETWVSRSQQNRDRVEAVLRENLLTSRWLMRLLSDEEGLVSPGPELFRDSPMLALAIYSKAQDEARWKNLVELKKNNVITSTEAVTRPPGTGDAAFDFRMQGDHFVMRAYFEQYQLVLVFPRNLLIELAADVEPFLTMVEATTGQTVLSSTVGNELPKELREKIVTSSGVDLVDSIQIQGSRSKALVAVSAFKSFPLAMVTFGANSRVDETWRSLLAQFLGASVLLVGLSLLVGWYYTRTMTARLEGLEATSEKIGLGDFKVQLDQSGSDEVAALAKALSVMANKIQDLFAAQEKQIRIESEMALAQTVQSTLFPERHSIIGNFEVIGHYQSASECSGDLWGYWESKDSIFLYVLDATGHGVPAALMTSATRAVIALFEQFEKAGLSQIVMGLNQTLHKVGNKTHQATGFVCQVDKATGAVRYINASHVPTYAFPQSLNKKTRWNSVSVLSDPISLRLGERPDTIFEIGTHQMAPGETLVLFTDGLNDVKNRAGDEFVDRKAVKAMIETLVDSPNDLKKSFQGFVKQFDTFRAGTVMPDDVTLIWFRRLS